MSSLRQNATPSPEPLARRKGHVDRPARADAAPGQAGLERAARLEAAQLGGLLLALYALARAESVQSFQHQVMVLLSEVIAFDGGWWGRSTVEAEHHHVTCSCLYNFPDDTPLRLNTHDPYNMIARRVSETPNRAHHFFAQDLHEQPSSAALNDYIGSSQTLCIAGFDGATGLMSFLSVMRREATPVFDRHDHELLELLMPHLAAALDLCCVTQMAQMRHGGNEAMLTSDQEGWVCVSEHAARTLLCREWPGWTGPRLPPDLVERMATRLPVFLGRKIHVEVKWSGEHALLTLRPREPRDALTRQECAVADGFSSGLSYKEVASQLHLAPATVRHHLRAVYLKLGVADKAALAQVLGRAVRKA